MTAQGRRGMRTAARLTRIPLRVPGVSCPSGCSQISPKHYGNEIPGLDGDDEDEDEGEDVEFNCVITCALAYAIGSSRASDVLTSVAMLDAIKRSDERSFAAN